MAGTDRSRESTEGGPAVILVRPQLPENIGAAARAMANFGLSEMRLVEPRETFPNDKARAFAASAVHVIDGARVFSSLEEAVADLGFLYATTARERGQAKIVDAPDDAARMLRARIAEGEKPGIIFGPERTGLENDEVALADRVLTFPVNPAYASLNLGQAVLLVGYEWFKSEGMLPFAMQERFPLAKKEQLLAFFAHIESALDRAGFFYPAGKKPKMTRNLRNIFHRVALSEQDVRTLHGAVAALEEGPRGPSRRERRVLDLPAGGGED